MALKNNHPMKTSQKKPVQAIDEVEDLTLFLDEDFDTDEVDLFEFTSMENSPLTQLKSVVLSLDWEIDDATLEQLSEEISILQQSELFHNDKVALVYLQALNKVGRYIQSEQVHAHPNAVRLLLTLYYDFEKIVSSSEITGSEITSLIKGDVRKFKILQYQIAQAQGKKVPELAETKAEGGTASSEEKSNALFGVHAAVLGLDWDVSDKSLSGLSEQLNALQNQYPENRFVLVLIQGLHALNSYISDERGHAHPEAFSLLHFFYEGLRLLIENNETDETKCQTIILERINSLNNLKAMIAAMSEAAPSPEEEEFLDIADDEEDSGQFMTDEESSAVGPAADTTEEIEDIASLSDFVEAEEEQKDIIPALADSQETGRSAAEIEQPPEKLDDKLDLFFGEGDKIAEPVKEEEPLASRSIEEITEDEFLPEGEVEETGELAPALTPALTDFVEEGGFDEAKTLAEADETVADELEDKLDFFFGEDEEKTPAPEPIKEEAAPATSVDELFEEEKTEVPEVPETPETAEEVTPALEEVAPDLTDFGEEGGFDEAKTLAEADETVADELEDKLDFFFGEDEEKTPAPEPIKEEAAPAASVDELFEEEKTEVPEVPEPPETAEKVTPALTDFGEKEGFDEAKTLAEADETIPEALEENLDFFFGADEEAPAAEVVAEETAPADATLDDFFDEDVSEKDTAAPKETAPTLDEHQILVRKLQTDFNEKERALKDEIQSLRQEVQELRQKIQSQ